MIFFLQMFVILAVCRACGWAVRRFLHQPQVIGEMIAGVILGPSLLGGISPEVQQFLFPPESKPLLNSVAQTGIAIYMFLVGLDFRSDDFKANAPSAVAVSVSGHRGAVRRRHAGDALAYARARAVRFRRLALQCHAVPGRGHRHHGIPGAGAHHSRSRTSREH